MGNSLDEVALKAAQEYAGLIRHAQLSIDANVGHTSFWEDCDRFNPELQTFAKQLSAIALSQA